ncbi:MAG: hypothetical protein WC749_00670 [Dehalococcoidia bacterium]
MEHQDTLTIAQCATGLIITNPLRAAEPDATELRFLAIRRRDARHENPDDDM